MGMSRAFMEESVFDSVTGVHLTSNLLGNQVAINLDCGPIDTILHESGHGDGAYGTSGIGEDTTDGGTPAACGAVYNAIGKWVNPPITPDKVLKALGKI